MAIRETRLEQVLLLVILCALLPVWIAMSGIVQRGQFGRCTIQIALGSRDNVPACATASTTASSNLIPLRVQADRALVAEDLEAAVARYARAYEEDPTDYLTRFRLGTLRLTENDIEGGLAVLRGLEQIDRYFLDSAETLRLAGDIEAALQQTAYAVRTTPDSYDANVEHGRLLRANGFAEESIEAHTHAILLNPERWEAYIGLGETLELEYEQYDSALENYLIAVEKSAEFPFVRRYPARIYMKQGQLDLAFTEIQASAMTSYDHYLASEILVRQNDIEGAISFLEIAVEQRPEVKEWRDKLQQLQTQNAP